MSPKSGARRTFNGSLWDQHFEPDPCLRSKAPSRRLGLTYIKDIRDFLVQNVTYERVRLDRIGIRAVHESRPKVFARAVWVFARGGRAGAKEQGSDCAQQGSTGRRRPWLAPRRM